MITNPIESKKSLVLMLGAVFILFIFIFMVYASDFDFYATELIAKESYRRVSMDFKDASLKNILKVFSQQSGLNFIASESVQDRLVTLYLDNVPLQEALNKIISANNLIYELEPGSNIFIVKELGRPGIDLITKIYNLKYARLKESRLEKNIVAGSAGSGSASGSTSGTSSGGSTSGASLTEAGIEETVQELLTDNGKVMTDIRTNSLIVTDIPSQFEIIDKVIALLDVPTPQVMIEVEMLDVSKRVIDQMGVETTPTIMSLTGASRNTKFPFSAENFKTFSPASKTFTYGTLSNAVFTAVLELLTTDTRTKFLARPRILTLSNETAEIKITTNEAIGQQTTTTSAEGTSTSTAEAERFETGVSLRVTPQIDSYSDMVTMFIEPKVSEAKTGGTFGGVTYKDPETRSSKTTLMVKNGDTIVVGGLIKTDQEVIMKKVPFLGDIPFLGAIFRHRDNDAEERELIVFITPHILGAREAVALARAEVSSPMNIPHREQDSAVLRRKEIDNMLQKWEN